MHFKIAKWRISEIPFWNSQALGTRLVPRAELQPQLWVSLCQVELSALHCCLACVSSLSFCVYECVMFIVSVITLNLRDQNTASCRRVVVSYCVVAFLKSWFEGHALHLTTLLVNSTSFWLKGGALSYLMFMCHQKCAYKPKGDVHRLSAWIGGVGGSWQSMWVSEAGEEIFNRGVTNLMR